MNELIEPIEHIKEKLENIRMEIQGIRTKMMLDLPHPSDAFNEACTNIEYAQMHLGYGVTLIKGETDDYISYCSKQD